MFASKSRNKLLHITFALLFKFELHRGGFVSEISPHMRSYVYGHHYGIAILDLRYSLYLYRQAVNVLIQFTVKSGIFWITGTTVTEFTYRQLRVARYKSLLYGKQQIYYDYISKISGILFMDSKTHYFPGAGGAYDYFDRIVLNRYFYTFYKENLSNLVHKSRYHKFYDVINWTAGCLTNQKGLYRYKQNLTALFLRLLRLYRKNPIKVPMYKLDKLGAKISRMDYPTYICDLLIVIGGSRDELALEEGGVGNVTIMSVLASNKNPLKVAYPLPGNLYNPQTLAFFKRFFQTTIDHGLNLAHYFKYIPKRTPLDHLKNTCKSLKKPQLSINYNHNDVRYHNQLNTKK